MKSTDKRILFVLTFLALTASAYAQSPREQLQQMVEQLQKTPNDNSLRERIIKLGAEIKPAPAIPPEAKRPFVMAGTYQKEAKKPSDFALAIATYQDALKIAPWWGDAYYNLSVSLESAGRLDEAKHALELYLLTQPEDAEKAQNHIYALDAKKNLAAKHAAEAERAANSPEARAARQKQQDEELIRSLDGVRFDCPQTRNMSGTTQWNEHWVVIKGKQLTAFSKIIKADPDLARAGPQYAVGRIGESIYPITGAVAREVGRNYEETYRITSDRIVSEFILNGRSEGNVTCRRSQQ